MIYVRHGEPAARLKPFVFGLMPSESWRYARADGDLLFHFSSGADDNGGGDLYDYRLVESVLDLHGAADAPVDQLLLSRQSLSPLYGKMLNWGAYGAARSALARARDRPGEHRVRHDHRQLRAAVRPPPVGRGQPRSHRPRPRDASRPPGLRRRLARQCPADPGSESSYSVRVRLAVLDGGGRVFAAVDTTVIMHAPSTLEPGQYLVGRAELPLPAGRWDWRAALQVGDSTGTVVPRDTVRVAPAGTALALSDLALGAVGASAVWLPTAVDTAYLTPFGIVREGSELELYYEAAGAHPGAHYAHEIAVYRLKGDPARADHTPVVRLGFEEAAADSLIRARRTIQLRRLKPGRYLVEVRVTGPGGASDTRRREIRVLGRAR